MLVNEQCCSLGLERLGLKTVSGHFWSLCLVSILSLQYLGLVFGLDAPTSRSRLSLETLTSRSRHHTSR